MCLSTNNRSTMSAGAPRRPRQRLLGCRFAKASYTVATIASSASTTSACFIQSSRRSLTSSAIRPSPKLSCARRISITTLPPGVGHGGVGTQQIVIELTYLLNRLLQLPVIVQPAANLGHSLLPNADLSRLSPSITDRQDVHLMAFAARTFRTAALVTHDTLSQSPTP